MNEMVRHGMARQGKARQGKARQGKARHNLTKESKKVRIECSLCYPDLSKESSMLAVN